MELKYKSVYECSKRVYTIGEFPESVNGNKYWISTDKMYAIWYLEESNIWIIGQRGSLGHDRGFIACGPGGLKATDNDGGMKFEQLSGDCPITRSNFPYAKKNSFIILESNKWKQLCDFNFVMSEFSERK